jgi:hypothetical protein
LSIAVIALLRAKNPQVREMRLEATPVFEIAVTRVVGGKRNGLSLNNPEANFS